MYSIVYGGYGHLPWYLPVQAATQSAVSLNIWTSVSPAGGMLLDSRKPRPSLRRVEGRDLLEVLQSACKGTYLVHLHM
jgi:hypothetical protein